MSDTGAAPECAPGVLTEPRRCLICSRPEGVTSFAKDDAVRCTDCITAHGAAVTAYKRSANGRRAQASTLRAAGVAAKDADLQARAAVRAGARGETYVIQATLLPQDRLRLKNEEKAEQRLNRAARRVERGHDAAARVDAVAARKAERRPLARLASSVLPALRAATTLDEEIRALVIGLDERASAWVLKRWGYLEWPVPSLESLGEAAGVTRERTRQIIALHEQRLKQLREGDGAFHLPLAERAVAALSARGGMLDTAAFHSALETEGVSASPAALRALIALGASAVIPVVVWDQASDLWLDGANQEVLRDGSLDRARRRLLLGGHRALKRSGAVSVTRIANAAPIPHDHAISLLFGPTSSTRLSGYIVPDVQGDSRLSRRALEMATVSPGIVIEDIRLGIRRIVPKPIRLPAPVIRAVLERHRAFRLDGGSVYPVSPVALDQLLYPADVTLVNALRQRGGVMVFPEVKSLLSSAGIPQGYFLRAAHAAWIVGLRGAFGLRGHPGAARLPETNERRTPGLERSRVFLKLFWPDEASAVVRYRVIPASLRGVLRLPNRLMERMREPGDKWTVSGSPSLPEGATVEVGVEGGALWDLRPWLVAINAQPGQHIEVSVAFPTRQVTLRLIDAEAAAADEARWTEEQLLRWSSRQPNDAKVARTDVRGGRPKATTVMVKEYGDYFAVPNEVHDVSDVSFYRLTCTPSPDSDLLLVALPSFPLAPGTSGVVMCLIISLTASQGKRRFYSDLLETGMLERSTTATWEEASQLVPHLEQHIVRGRLALSWREYHLTPGTSAPSAESDLGTTG